ncbi:OmpA family protein [Winogradskyella maritima]|uniref:OmpA family protein n=1 Tax=Winogradskyella maritima TaxID=1517766 RepID=A0ABV8AII6_9FLAO|nr:OmpA family protein [Winogradskyella maritima]
MMKTRFLTLIALMLISFGFAQEKLADKFFKNYGYAKAIELYEEVLKDGDSSLHVLTRLGDSYYNNSKTADAAKYYQLAVDGYEKDMSPKQTYRYIQSLVSTGQYEKAEEWAMKLKAQQEANPDMQAFIDEDFDIKKISPEYDERLIVKLDNLEFNSELSDFGAFMKDNVMYFASSRDKSSEKYDWNLEPFLEIYQVEMREVGGFGNATKLASRKINTDYHEASVAISNDGMTMYFTRDNVTKKNRLEYTRDGTTNLKIYKAVMEDGVWQDPQELPFNSDKFSTGHPTLNSDNTQLYFASDREGGYGGTDLYVVDINEDGTYAEPRNLGPNINTAGRELFPFVAKDNTLYYSSDGLLNFGLLDIYSSNILNDSSAESKNLGEPYNSGYDDFAYSIDTETQMGFLSSNREGGKGSDDIYGFNAYLCEQAITGTAANSKTGEPLAGVSVRLIDEEGKVLETVETTEDGTYTFTVLCERSYTISGSKPDYREDQKTVLTDDTNEKNNVADLQLEPLIDTDQIVINPIFFDFDKWNIRTDAQYELENIVDVMRAHPEMVIKIESHTDSRGGDRYNMKLSDRRAKSTRDYLYSRGISEDRIESAIGYGETQLLNKCSNGVKCTPEEHQLNRRSYFYILED